MDVLHDHLARMWREIDQAEASMVVAALMATEPQHRYRFRWRHAPQAIQTGVDAGQHSNDLALWVEVEPPEVWCDLHGDPDAPLTVTPDGAVYGRVQ